MIGHLRVFGSTAMVHRPSKLPGQDKLAPRSEPAIFLGYASDQKGYRFQLEDGRITTSNNAIFDEYQFIEAKERAHIENLRKLTEKSTLIMPTQTIADESMTPYVRELALWSLTER